MQRNNKYKSLAKDTGILAIGNFGTKILSFLCVPLYTAYLSTSDVGIADVLMTTITLLLPVFTLDLGEAVLRFLYDESIDKKKVYGIGIWSYILAVFFACLSTWVVCGINVTIKPYALFFILIFGFATLENLLSNVIKGNGKTKHFAIKGLVYTLFFVTTNILLLSVMHWGLRGYLISYIVAYAASCLYMLVVSGVNKSGFSIRIDKCLLKSMLIYSVPFIPASISWWINSFLDKYMLIWIEGVSANGLYSTAQKIPALITVVTGIFTQAWQLSAMKNYKDDDFSHFFSEVFRLICIVLLFGTSAVFLLNKPIALFLFQKDFYVAWKYVPMLTVAAIFSTLAAFLASVFTSAKKTNILFVSTTAGAIVNIVGNYFLIRYIGIMGASIATVLSFMVMVIVRIVTMRKIVKVNISVLRLAFSIFIMFLVAGILPYTSEVVYYIVAGLNLFLIVGMNYRDVIKAINMIKNRFFEK